MKSDYVKHNLILGVVALAFPLIAGAAVLRFGAEPVIPGVA